MHLHDCGFQAVGVLFIYYFYMEVIYVKTNKKKGVRYNIMAQTKINVTAKYTISGLDYSKTQISRWYNVEIYRYINNRGILARVVVTELEPLIKRHPGAKYDTVVDNLPIPTNGDPSACSDNLNGVRITVKLSFPVNGTHFMDLDRYPIDVEFCAVDEPGAAE